MCISEGVGRLYPSLPAFIFNHAMIHSKLEVQPRSPFCPRLRSEEGYGKRRLYDGSDVAESNVSVLVQRARSQCTAEPNFFVDVYVVSSTRRSERASRARQRRWGMQLLQTPYRVVNVQDAVRSAVPLNKHSWLFLVSTASQCIYVGAIPPRPLKINAVTGGLTRFAPEISAVITNTDSSSSVAERGGTCNGPYAPMSANEPNHMEYPRILWTQKETACQQLMARSLDVDMAPETRSRLQAHVVVTLRMKESKYYLCVCVLVWTLAIDNMVRAGDATAEEAAEREVEAVAELPVADVSATEDEFVADAPDGM
ncbi:unnamed protein product [Rangifer tarandus platyrhynchus]|uniref:Uncharacterized protein n=1 Tax=Rangifer tarandus platyrhynchus TaxID=3082113 RepID=A0ABN8XMX3_RANTA|nr:unnamed protein product [Rangifer tarandus platyrhynchus]